MQTVRASFIAIVLVVVGSAYLPTRAQEGFVAAPLITSGKIQLNLAGADLVLTAAKQKAAAMKLKMNIAIVDDGGHLIAFARMDGARPASGYTAQTKATAAATFRAETGPLPKDEPDMFLSLSLQMRLTPAGAS